MSVIQAIILGIVQGLTEFIPVSSSGHLVLIKELLGIDSGQNIAFETAVHAATVLSTITVLWKTIISLIKKTLQFEWNNETQYVVKIFISMIPVLITELFFKDTVERLFGEGALLVGIMLLVTACLLTLSTYIKTKESKDIGYFSAFLIGLAQAIAVLPGLSRSGATISVGLMSGIKKSEVAQFSFLMVLIPILGESLLSLIAGEFSLSASGITSQAIIAGFITAYISGLIACKFMIEIVKKIKLVWFAIYCAIVGIVSIVISL